MTVSHLIHDHYKYLSLKLDSKPCISALTLEEIKKIITNFKIFILKSIYDTEKLIKFLQETIYSSAILTLIFSVSKKFGSSFLKLIEEKFRSCGMKVGSAAVLADFAKERTEQKKVILII
jgi:hypothetical protein